MGASARSMKKAYNRVRDMGVGTGRRPRQHTGDPAIPAWGDGACDCGGPFARMPGGRARPTRAGPWLLTQGYTARLKSTLERHPSLALTRAILDGARHGFRAFIHLGSFPYS